MEEKFKVNVVNLFVDMPKLLEDAGYYVSTSGAMLCPFHNNENTPASKMYKDETGYKLWCFAEQRMYGSWDVYKKLLHKDPSAVFYSIWNNLDEETKNKVIDLFGEVRTEEVPYSYILEKFKDRKIDYSTLCKELQEYFYSIGE